MTEPIQKFGGFPAGKTHTLMLPALVVTELLALIDDLAELKVTLFMFWAVQQREGIYRYLRLEDFIADTHLMRALGAIDGQLESYDHAHDQLDRALARAVERETLLSVDVNIEGETTHLYFINAEPGRVAVEQIRKGEWKPGTAQNPIEILPERPTIYRLYEENIGPLTPMIAESLKDAERDYGVRWIEDAIRIAVENNALTWRYVQSVLTRWQKEGKRDEIDAKSDQRDGKRYISGKYADFIEH